MQRSDLAGNNTASQRECANPLPVPRERPTIVMARVRHAFHVLNVILYQSGATLLTNTPSSATSDTSTVAITRSEPATRRSEASARIVLR